MTVRPPLTELQIAILSTLWNRGEATSSQVRSDLEPERSLALTTVTTLLGRLEKKGVVEHERDGRRYLYRASISRDEVQRSMVRDLTASLFDGDSVSLASHVIENGDVDENGIDRLQLVLDDRRRAHREGRSS